MVDLPEIGDASAVFIPMASTSVGGGHLARCAALAANWAPLGWRSTVVCETDPRIILPRAATAFRRWATSIGSDASVPLAVFDGYDLGVRQQTLLRGRAGRLFAIDDLADRDHDVDVLVDATPGRSPADYAGKVPAACRILTGIDHAVLRPELLRSRAKLGSRRRGVVVSMGATDPTDATSLVLEALAGRIPELSVVLGPAAPHLQRLQDKYGGAVEFLVDPPDFEERVGRAALVVGGAGSSAIERAFLGTPSVLCVLCTNQAGLGPAMAKSGAAELMAEHEWRDASTLEATVTALLADARRLDAMSRLGMTVVDGRGVWRIAAAIPKDRQLPIGRVRLRLFEPADGEWLFWLQSKPETRRFSRSSAPPDAATHAAWIQNRLAPTAGPLFVLELIHEHGQQPAGFVRLDLRNCARAEVSIAVDPAFRREGLGLAGLALLRDVAPGLALLGYVQDKNTASRRLFEAAGYRKNAPEGDGHWYEHCAA